MTTTRFFDWFQLAALACLASLGIGRAIALYAHRVRVVVIDWQRALGLVGLLHYQIRREEKYLAGAYGDAYRDYCARVGRYLKW